MCFCVPYPDQGGTDGTLALSGTPNPQLLAAVRMMNAVESSSVVWLLLSLFRGRIEATLASVHNQVSLLYQ